MRTSVHDDNVVFDMFAFCLVRVLWHVVVVRWCRHVYDDVTDYDDERRHIVNVVDKRVRTTVHRRIANTSRATGTHHTYSYERTSTNQIDRNQTWPINTMIPSMSLSSYWAPSGLYWVASGLYVSHETTTQKKGHISSQNKGGMFSLTKTARFLKQALTSLTCYCS